MLRQGIRHCLALCLAAGFGAGCAHSDADRTYPPDPLLLSKHPVTGKFGAPASAQVAFAAPSPPAVPDKAVASGEQKPEAERIVPATPVSNHPASPK